MLNALFLWFEQEGALLPPERIVPTLLELARCTPFDVPDSRSFAQFATKSTAVLPEWRRGYAEYYGNRHRVTQKIVWDGPWKFVFNGFDFDELYNLDDDPWEQRNLADDPAHGAQLEQMTRLFWHYARTTGDTPLAETLYPALRLGTVGPLDENHPDTYQWRIA